MAQQPPSARQPLRNDDGAYYFEDLKAYVSPDAFVYDVAATALQRQLDRFRDVLTISLGLIAAALASIAFVLVGKMSRPDAILAGIVAFGGVIALGTACFWDPREAPNPLALSGVFETEPEYVTAFATAGVLKAIRENQRPLQIKMILARVGPVDDPNRGRFRSLL